jgi:hypothetical protein
MSSRVKLSWLSSNNSFKPTPHRGVGHVPALSWRASAASLRGGLTQALRSHIGHSGQLSSQWHLQCLFRPLDPEEMQHEPIHGRLPVRQRPI